MTTTKLAASLHRDRGRITAAASTTTEGVASDRTMSGGTGKVVCAAYLSPTLVLLAFDWSGAEGEEDFLGFAIERSPGFDGRTTDWLPNRIGFNGPPPGGGDLPSNEAPIQKFYWWDARIDTGDRGKTFTYRVVPVTGVPEKLKCQEPKAGKISVTIPQVEEHGISTWFNRAVVSSQAFSVRFPDISTPSQQKAARAWLANGLEQAVPKFLDQAAGKDVEGAIYHLTDEIWIIPAMINYGGALSLAYNHRRNDTASDAAIDQLIQAGRPETAFAQRTKANIMHNKFLVRVGEADHAEAVLTGSTNFTSEGLSAQANVSHIFESPELASLYLARKRLLDGDPSLTHTQKDQEGWSNPIAVGDATIRVFFPPEPRTSRVSLDAIVAAINNAKQSVLICAFDPTDGDLLHAVFSAGDRDLMMLGLVNRVPAHAPAGNPARADVAASIAIMDRANENHDFAGFGAFKANETPDGFEPERVLWPHENPKTFVRVHHKFVVIDAEAKDPVVFTGSANFSGNSLHNNDENLLEITKCPRLARLYFAEFMRLFEHYRARDAFQARMGAGGEEPDHARFTLTSDDAWTKKYFQKNSPEFKARVAMANPA